MNDKIIDFFRQEVPIYQCNTKAFWDDEHIKRDACSSFRHR